MLLKVASKDANSAVTALSQRLEIDQLNLLSQSLTWDRGMALARHK